MTLDEFCFRFFSSRVISVLSYYLTSLVTSIFYSDEQIPYLITISLLFRFVSYLLFLAFPLLPHIRMNAFAVSCRLLRIRTITFCICFQIDPSEYLLACVISYDRFGFLLSAFSDLRLLFGILLLRFLLRVASWILPGSVLAVTFLIVRDIVLSTQHLQALVTPSSILVRVFRYAASTSGRLLMFYLAYIPVPSLWKCVAVTCVPLCDSLPACTQFCLFSFVHHKETRKLVHYLHSSHPDLSLRRFSLRVGSFFFVPLL